LFRTSCEGEIVGAAGVIFGLSEIFLQGNENTDELDVVPKLRYWLLKQNVTEVMLEIYTQRLLLPY